MIPRELLRKVRQIEIRTRHLVTDAFAGEYHSVFKGRGMEFHEVREYVPGDDIRAIDWNVTARTGAPHVKRFIEERELTVLLMVDISGSQTFGSGRQLKRELAAESAALLALAAVRNNDRVGLVLFAGDVEYYLPPAKGLRHVLRLVREVLSQPARTPGTRLAPALTFLNHTQHRRCVCFLLSDFQSPPEEYRRLLAPTARRH
ncbi:MAG: DUF58 domain-containing protein, partial [Candidatus Marinimicrobia bacterium]|nr:DUF58 domain-containing protein [Candidatus Neomarinimicrobiota bacterium]